MCVCICVLSKEYFISSVDSLYIFVMTELIVWCLVRFFCASHYWHLKGMMLENW